MQGDRFDGYGFEAVKKNNRGTDLFNPEAMVFGCVLAWGNWWDR